MKGKRGITLVSLVVTIIVLIILAGVSINLTLGENGIITMAKRARENMELARVDEEKQLNELYAQIVAEGGSSGNASDDAIIRLAEFKREIASALTDIGIETEENADISTITSNIRSLTGETSADKVSYDNTNSGLTTTNVQGAVDELNESLEWKLVDTISHNAGIEHLENLSVDLLNYKEIKIVTLIEDGNIHTNSVFTDFFEQERIFVIGGSFYHSNFGTASHAHLTNTTIAFARSSIMVDGVEKSGTFYIYVR